MLFEGVTERVYGRTFALRGLARDPPSFTLAMVSTRSAPRPSSAALSPDAQPSDFASTAQGPLFLAIPLLFLCHVRPRLATDADLDIPLRPAWPSGSAGSKAPRGSGYLLWVQRALLPPSPQSSLLSCLRVIPRFLSVQPLWAFQLHWVPAWHSSCTLIPLFSLLPSLQVHPELMVASLTQLISKFDLSGDIKL